MNKQDQLFNEAFQKYGGSLVAMLPDNIEVVEDIKEHFNPPFKFMKIAYPNLPEINFGLVANEHLNATAMKNENGYYIGINSGAYFIIKDVFRKMMASRNVLPHLGNNNSESEDQQLLNILRSDVGLYYPMPPIQAITDAVDPLRQKFALYYAQFAFDFLTLHECAHIIRGHIGYLYSLSSPTVFSEINYSPNEYQAELYSFRQTIEMDADSLATNRAFLNALQNMDLDKQNGHQSHPFFSDWPTFAFHWTFAIYVFFRLWGFDEYSIEKVKQQTHPPSVARIAMIAGNIATLFIERPEFKTNTDSVLKASIDACFLAEEALIAVSFQPNQTNEFFKHWRDIALGQYLKDIRMNWNNVRPLLEPFAFGNLPPLQPI